MRRTLKRVTAVAVVAGGLALAKKTDADVLARVGTVAAGRVRAAAPDTAALAGPLSGLKPGNALPVEERVRLRVEADKAMAGGRVDVLPGAAAGEVRLRGVVPTAAQRQLAGTIAEGTVGVTAVANEIAVPEQ